MDEIDPYRIETFERLESTNDEAMARLKAGDPGDLFIVAASQTGGRGRQGRVWASPQGNLYATLALVNPSPMAVAPQLGFVAGVSLAKTLRDLLGGDQRLRIKWPNDVLFDGAKLAGILLESTTLSCGRTACVIGFGVNCLSHPTGLAYAATNMGAAGRQISAPEILAALAVELRRQVAIWNRGQGFAAIRASWTALALDMGERLEVVLPNMRKCGCFAGIDPLGRLMLETDGNFILVDAGDVFLPGRHMDATRQNRPTP